MKEAEITLALKKPVLGRSEKLSLVLRLSLPAILAELATIAEEYIDAAMVGSLGANATGAIGLVASSTWVMGSLLSALAAGFYVQASQLVGADRNRDAENVLRQSMICLLITSLFLLGIGTLISPHLPVWLGGAADIRGDASRYFMIYCFAIPFMQMRQLAGGMLQSSGDMKTPSTLNALICLADVIFNFFLIFPTRHISFAGLNITLPGADLGVTGAALGTSLSEVVISMIMLACVCFRCPALRLKKGGSWRIRKATIKTALRISAPMGVDYSLTRLAHVAATALVAPLGTAAVAANSLAVTAEGICYMPGFGIGMAATVLTGQSIGADRQDLAKSFSRLSVLLGILFMTVTGAGMFFICPAVFTMLTVDTTVRSLGVLALRTELFAEPFYAASIVSSGVFRGAGDTLVPCIMNLAGMWAVRLPLALLLIPRFGLQGYWLAMAIDLTVRGIVFLIRFIRGRWLKKKLV